jgi:hypothetical protein
MAFSLFRDSVQLVSIGLSFKNFNRRGWQPIAREESHPLCLSPFGFSVPRARLQGDWPSVIGRVFGFLLANHSVLPVAVPLTEDF